MEECDGLTGQHVIYMSAILLDHSNEMILAIATVEGQKKSYSDLDVRRATKARKMQDTIGFPSL